MVQLGIVPSGVFDAFRYDGNDTVMIQELGAGVLLPLATKSALQLGRATFIDLEIEVAKQLTQVLQGIEDRDGTLEAR